MVFESYVVSILNKFLGQYVENLDPSQFQMSIWGGDVKLENLVLKENALDELDLPVKVLRGHLGQLILKIPWKNLYSEPVVAKVDEVYLLARPNTDIKYNTEKEGKILQEKKQQELTAIEEAIKYAEEAKNKSEEDKEKNLSFAEKLAMHIVKNIQVFVSNIHIRYEDPLSNEDGPFSVGITLENLSAESVDDNWQPVVIDSKQSLVNKLARLDNLALYLNSHDKIGELPTSADWVNIAKAGIARGEFGGNRPDNYNYVIEPLTLKTKAILDTNSVPNLSIPKVFVEIIMKELGLILSRHQFKDIVRLADNFDRMKTNSQYRKYKPFVPLSGNSKAWWNYAIRAVLEEDVKRRSKNWSWQHIVNHRMTCHKYMKLYKEKLSHKKVSDKVEKEIEHYEEIMDVLNITIWRKQAEIETKKEGTNYELNEKRKKSEGGWFSGFFGKKSKGSKQVAGLSKEEEAAEEQKLYAAIGYSESDAPVKLPREYVAYKLKFEQKRISVELRDDSVEPACSVSSVSLEDLFMELGYRPGAQAVRVETKLGNLNVLGCPLENQSPPDIIRSIAGDTDIADYVNASFETNPLDGKCDQRVRLTVQPLEVIYHANTIEKLMNFFQLPEDVQLSEISAAAYSQIDGLRNQSRTNLSYAIETRTLLDIDVLIHSPFVIIPQNGVLTENCSLLVIDLGCLKVSSDPSQERITNTKSMSPEELEEKVYDRFNIEMKQLQILMAKPGEDWKDCRNEENSSLHVLKPFGLDIHLFKCLAADDIRLTQIRLAGVLSSLQVHVTDKRLDDLMKLALSIPIPGETDTSSEINAKKPQSFQREVKTAAQVSALDVVVKKETAEISDELFETPPESPENSSIDLSSGGNKTSDHDKEMMKLAKAEQTNVAVKFEILQINLKVSKKDKFGIETPLLEVDLLKLGTQVFVRQYDLTVMANIGDILVKEMIHGIGGAPLELVSTPADLDILAVQFIQADRNHPRFKESFNSTEKAIDVQLASLKVVLHQEALLNLLEFANNFLPASEEEIIAQQQEELAAVDTDEDKTDDDKKALANKSVQDEVIEVKVDARLGEFTAVITSMNGDLAELQMKQLEAGVSMLSDRITVVARMQDFSVVDGLANALYPKIVSIVNEEVFNVEVVIYNGATEEHNYGNMEKVDTKFLMNVGRIKVIFLNRFVSNLLEFINNFQRAQEAIQNAGKTAAQSATQSLQEYNKNSPRVKLDVSIQAPLVIVPVNSQSDRALVANLGNLEVHNNFKVVHGGEGQDIAVVDNMAVSFTSLQVSVAIISKDEAIVAQRFILKPISLELSLSRSLSSWYHDIPDVDIAGKLHAVNIDIGTDDIKTALAITSENLTEGATISSDAEDEKYSSAESALAVLETPDEEVSKVVDENKTWVAVKFMFSVETVAARIYKNIQQLDANNKASWDHPADQCLGHFSLDNFKVAGSLLANGAMDASVVLQTIRLDDKRPNLEKGITTMIERRTDERISHSDTSNMIDLQFAQSKGLDKQIAIIVKGMSIIINVEFLLVLSTVFTEALDEAPAKESESTAEVLAEARMKSTDLASSSTAPPTATNQSPALQLTVKVEEPEIFLLADAKQKNTNALIVKNTLDLSLTIRDERMFFQTSIQNLHILTASFEKSRREISQADVLRVKQIGLHLSSMIGGRPHIDLNTTVAYLNISPAFVGIATAVASSLGPSKDEDSEGNNEDVPDLFKPADIADCNNWYLKEVARGQLVPGSRVFARAKDLKSYAPGLITEIGQKIKVILDDGTNWSCDINDVTGVVLDETPLVKEIAVGTKIISLLKEGEPMQAGIVTKLMESSDAENPNILVRFSQQQEEVKAFEYIRLLRSVKHGAPPNKPVVSSAVWVRLPDKEHYGQGFIAKKDWRYQVKFANGTDIYHFVNDPLALVLDRSPRPEHVMVGSDVVAPIPNKPLMYPGRVKKIAVSGYEIQFDNGAVHELSIHDLKLMKVPKKEGHRLTVRTLLWIKYSDNFYYRGYVDGIDNKIYVRFYEHEKKCSFPLNDQTGLIRDVTPREVLIGENVVILKGTYGMKGVVTKVESRESSPVYLIEAAGNEMWVPLKDIRRFDKTTSHKDVSHDLQNTVESVSDNREEQLLMNVDGFVFNVEAEKGGNLISLLNMRGNLSAEVKNWQEKLNGKAELRLEANYFNEELSEWEPLIEKLETKDGFRPWELSVGFKMNQDSADDDSESQMLVSVESSDVLELTITKTNLDVFTELGKSFSEAVTESIGGTSLSLEKTAPYEIKNELGTDVYIRPGNNFKAPPNMKGDVVLVRSGESLWLDFAQHLRLTSTSSDVASIKIAVEVDGYHEIKDISVKEASSAFFNVIPKKLHKQGFRSIVVQVTSPDGRKLVVLRSPFRMKNHCPVPLEIFVQNQSLELMATLNEDDYLNIPLAIANDDLGYFIKPGGFPYDKNVEEIRLSQVSKNRKKLYVCAAPWPDADPFYVQTRCESERYTNESGSRSNQPCYTLHYYPPVVLMNYLPFPVQFKQEGLESSVTLEGGNKLPIYTVDIDMKPALNIKLESYLGETYTAQLRLRNDLAQLSVLYLVSGSKKLVVGVYVKKGGSLEVTLYATYWLINHTGLPLEYKASDSDATIKHPANENDVAIFAFTSKPEMFSKNTLKLRTSGSDWSDKFSLDTAGSGGSLKCKTKDGKEIGIGSEIRLSYFSLTKIVVFTPLNLLVNQTKHSISLCDAEGVWYTVKSGETIPFWPNKTPAKNLKIKTDDSPVESILFDFQSNVNHLLRLDNEVGGACVTMFSKDAATVMTFTPYFDGAAPLRIDNDTSFEICYRQLNNDKVHVLQQKKTTVFTWDNLQGKREVEWFILGHEKYSAKSNFGKNNMGTLGEKDKPLCYWASFLDGLQRVLYFTENYTMAFRAQQDQLEVPSQEITLSLRGIGLSLVNNKKSIELAYLSITPSDVLWEEQKRRRRWKTMTRKACCSLENAYKIVQNEIIRGETPVYKKKVDNMTVNLETMEILEPDRRPIRRTFHPGVWVQFKQSAHEIQLHSKINDIQMDSQVSGSTFQTLFHSIPPPKTVAESNAPKPMIEASIITRKEENAIVSRIKYFKVLVQELDVKMDKGWLLELVALFGSENQALDETNYEEDKKVITTSLQSLNAAVVDVRNYYDYFHLSPLKVHVSFSVQGGSGPQTNVGGNVVDLLLNSLGVAVADVQDVVLKLAYFELNNQIYSQSQLIQVATNHYKSQAIKQAYVLVLGLDVLGNPFGLISGLTTGAKDLFYEPYQGLIQGPEEFAEGLALGVKSLVGHTIGGAAGAVSRITGTLGKGIAALTMDDEYQQSRRTAMSKKPTSVKEGLSRGGKGLLEGVFEGVTGVVTKPMEGAKKSGAKGFFKGMGKGLVGVVAKPVSGVVDFASSTFEGIKGTASGDREIKRVRPSRRFYSDKIMRPYNKYEAEGVEFFKAYAKGKETLASDSYVYHYYLPNNMAIMITNKHVLLMRKETVIRNEWENSWFCEIKNLQNDPKVNGTKITFSVPEQGKMFKKTGTKVVDLKSERVAEWIAKNTIEARGLLKK